MRKKLLGAMAALVAGTGGALAQSPYRGPAAVGRTGSYDGAGVQQAQFNQAIPPRLPDMGPGGPGFGGPGGPGGPGFGGPGGPGGPDMGPGGPGGPEGGPGWPPPGGYMQQPWERPPIDRPVLEQGLRSRGIECAPTLWFDGQYLLMFSKNMPIGFPLVTSGSPAGLGVLGQPTTSALYGGGDLSMGMASGFKLTAGFFRPEDHRLGFELTGLYTAPTSNDFFGRGSGNGIPTLARPFFNTATNQNAALIVSFPNFAAGSVSSRATSEFWGMEANGLWNAFRTTPGGGWNCSLNVLAGFRFAQLQEGLSIDQQSMLLPGTTAPYAGITVQSPTSLEVHDNFNTTNRFYGGQVGLQWQASVGRWFGGITAKVGLGLMHEEVTINGTSGSNNPGGTPQNAATVAVGGLFANASNIGKYRDDRFAILTDVNGTVGYNVTKFFTVTAGYNFIHMSQVARPSNQFDGRVDPSLVPTSANFGGAPSGTTPYVVKQTDYWLHGVNLGFIARY